jgi:hypothetical protein
MAEHDGAAMHARGKMLGWIKATGKRGGTVKAQYS